MTDTLPEPMRSLWHGQDYGITHLNVSGMSSVVIKAPRDEAEGWRNVVVMAQMQLHLMPTAPVFRLYLEFRDQPDNPFVTETFYNIGHESRADLHNLELLGRQDELIFHFYAAEDDQYLYSKSINWRHHQRQEIKAMVKRAQRHLENLKRRRVHPSVDFDRAKAEVMAKFEI